MPLLAAVQSKYKVVEHRHGRYYLSLVAGSRGIDSRIPIGQLKINKRKAIKILLEQFFPELYFTGYELTDFVYEANHALAKAAIENIVRPSVGSLAIEIEDLPPILNLKSKGAYDPVKNVIILSPSLENGRLIEILLHELCHFLQAILDKIEKTGVWLKQILITDYFKEIEKIYGDKFLKNVIKQLQSPLVDKDFLENHDLMFVLKSLIIDDALDLPVGTVLGYQSKLFKLGEIPKEK